MDITNKQEQKNSINYLVTNKQHYPNKDNQKKLQIEQLQEESHIARELEKLGISIRSDPLNAFIKKAESVHEESEEQDEEEDQGITSFTGHRLSLRSKIDAFESKIKIFNL